MRNTMKLQYSTEFCVISERIYNILLSKPIVELN